MEITIKRVSECSLEQLTEVWNEGFSDYFVPMKFTVELFTNRFANDELMPTRSVVAFMDNRPVGIVLNGFRMLNGKKVSWNGGTCVMPDYRRYGVGKAMIDACLSIYREEEVDIATLEAFEENHKAIALYEQKGYKVVDYLRFLEMKDAINPIPFIKDHTYSVKRGMPIDATNLPFYNYSLSWQSQWANLRSGGESLIIMDKDQPVGYILCKRLYDADGKFKDILLYQCQVDPKRSDMTDIARYGLSHIFASEHPLRCVSVNTPASQGWLIDILTEAGFEVRVKQVYMTQELRS